VAVKGKAKLGLAIPSRMFNDQLAGKKRLYTAPVIFAQPDTRRITNTSDHKITTAHIRSCICILASGSITPLTPAQRGPD